MKKLLSYISIFSMMVMLLWVPSFEAYAANISVSASSSSVKIGDTVTVTVSVPSDTTATVAISFPTDILSFSSATGTTNTNGGTITTTLGDPFSTSCTITFTAKTSGTATVSASSTKAGNSSTGEAIELGGGSTSITVANQTSGGGGGSTGETEKSADNFLASLRLSSGTLSPSFYYATTNYTATVGYAVTSVVVTATTSSAKGTIESVTGDGTVALSVGTNTIEIVVKAENGVKRTYTVVVTRQAEGETTNTETESETESETPGNVTADILQWQGETLTPVTEIPEEVIPQDFVMSEMVVGGEAIPALTFANGNLQVLYLENTNGAGSLYVYDEVQSCIYPFIKIQSEKSYVVVLLPNVETTPAPEGYQECTLSIEGKGVITAYQFVQTTQENTTQEGTTESDTTTDTTTTSWNSWFDFGAETFYAAEPVVSDFYLIYCMNESGETGWYMYDAVEETFQRYSPSLHVNNGTAIGGVADTTLQAQNAQLLAQIKEAQNLQRIIICVAIFVVAVLIIVIINLILNRRMDEELEDDEYDEDEYDEDDEMEIEFYEIPEVTVEEEIEDDDEIEIEFYEIPEVTVEEDVEDDDEMEIEFYEIPDEKTISTEKKEESREEKLSELERLLASRKVEDDGDDLEFIDLD